MEIIAKIMTGVVNVLVNVLCIMFLWNWLMPILFGISEIGFLQSFGLFLLIHILFKGIKIEVTTKKKEPKNLHDVFSSIIQQRSSK